MGSVWRPSCGLGNVREICGIYRATQLVRTESDDSDPGYLGDLRRNSLGVLLLLGWQTRTAALLSGVLLLLFALKMTGALGIKVPWTPPSSPQQVERFFWPVAGNTHSALIITGEIRLDTYSLVSEVRAIEGPPSVEASDGSVATHLLLRLGFMVCVREVLVSSVETSCSAAAGTLT